MFSIEQKGRRNILSFIAAMLFISLFSSLNINAQEGLGFYFDFARFKYDSTSAYVEFYYSFSQSDLTSIETDQGYMVEGFLHIEMQDTATGEYFINRDWRVPSLIAKDSDDGDQNLLGTFGAVIPEGVYSIKVIGKDNKNHDISKTIEDFIHITPFNEDKFDMSDIELASSISQSATDPNSIFYKNTLEVIPNPTMIFTDKKPVLFYYSELYNLLKTNSPEGYRLDKLLYNKNRSLVYNQSKNVQGNKDAILEVGFINLAKLPTGNYDLIISLINKSNDEFSVSSKRIYIFNPGVEDGYDIASNVDFENSDFKNLTEEECDHLFDVSKWVSSKNDNVTYENLTDVDGKRRFIHKFWSARDMQPETPANEFYKEYMERVDYANENFGNNFEKGYASDRGRIYILYGEPDFIERNPVSQDTKPYMIWHYDRIENGVQFVFADFTGFSNFQLIHSTKRGELYDEDYMEKIRTWDDYIRSF